MFRQIFYTQWKWYSAPVVPLALAAFGLPIFNTSRLGSPLGNTSVTSVQVETFMEIAQLLAPLYPALAFAVGVMMAAGAWWADHSGHHIYALSLPIPRWEYSLLRFASGAAFVAFVSVFLGMGSVLASLSANLPQGWHAYPFALTARFFLASLIVYSVFFPLAAGSKRTITRGVSGTVAFLILGELIASSITVDWSLVGWLVDALATWPGPFEVFTGSWLLIDV